MRFAWLCFPVAALTLATAWVPPAEEQDAAARAEIARGEYLVNAIGCADCHTPWVNGPDGPEIGRASCRERV